MNKYLLLLLFVCTYINISGQNIDHFSLSQMKEMNIKPDNNSLCKFVFDDKGLYSAQDSSKDYIIFNRPGKSSAELKASVLSAISSLFKSPKDVVTNLGDNIIQLERYAPNLYHGKYGDSYYSTDVYYSLIIQFKDGKIRYNTPSIKHLIITGVPMLGSLRLDTNKPITTLIEESYDRDKVVKEFNKTISEINKKSISADNW